MPVFGFEDPEDPEVISVALGRAHSLALLANGTVWAWGFDGTGQIGDGGTTPKDKPVPVPVAGFGDPSIAGVVTIAAGFAYSLAVTSSGGVSSWGDNSYGQLGSGSPNETSTAPQSVSGFTNGAGLIAGGGEHSLVVGVGCFGRQANRVGTARADNITLNESNDWSGAAGATTPWSPPRSTTSSAADRATTI